MFLIRIHYLSWPQSNQFPLKAGDSVVPLFTRLHHLISPGAEMQYNYLKEASKELAVTSFLQLLTECSRGGGSLWKHVQNTDSYRNTKDGLLWRWASIIRQSKDKPSRKEKVKHTSIIHLQKKAPLTIENNTLAGLAAKMKLQNQIAEIREKYSCGFQT